jgi:hypothetical protein
MAKVANATARLWARGAGLTQQAALRGTLPPMSPEQLRSEDVDTSSDLVMRAGALPALKRFADAMNWRSVGGAAC